MGNCCYQREKVTKESDATEDKVQDPRFRHISSGSCNLSILSYNILADGLAGCYPYLKEHHQAIEYRATLVMDTVAESAADVICL